MRRILLHITLAVLGVLACPTLLSAQIMEKPIINIVDPSGNPIENAAVKAEMGTLLIELVGYEMKHGKEINRLWSYTVDPQGQVAEKVPYDSNWILKAQKDGTVGTSKSVLKVSYKYQQYDAFSASRIGGWQVKRCTAQIVMGGTTIPVKYWPTMKPPKTKDLDIKSSYGKVLCETKMQKSYSNIVPKQETSSNFTITITLVLEAEQLVKVSNLSSPIHKSALFLSQDKTGQAHQCPLETSSIYVRPKSIIGFYANAVANPGFKPKPQSHTKQLNDPANPGESFRWQVSGDITWAGAVEGILKVKVTDADSGDPIKKMGVSLYTRNDQLVKQSSTSDYGLVQFGYPTLLKSEEDGDYYVSVAGSSLYQKKDGEEVKNSEIGGQKTVKLERTTVSTRFKVVDALRGIVLPAVFSVRDWKGATSTPDPSGATAVDLKWGEYTWTGSYLPEYLEKRDQPFAVEFGMARPYICALEPKLYPVTFKVVWRDNGVEKPLTGAIVTVSSGEMNISNTGSPTGADGICTLQLPKMGKGQYKVEARCDKYDPKTLENGATQALPPASGEFKIELEKSTVFYDGLTITVTNQTTGKPVSGATIRIDGGVVPTTESPVGTYTVDKRLAEGNHSIIVEATAYTKKSKSKGFTLNGDDQEESISVEGMPLKLQVKVIDEKGDPIIGAKVVLDGDAGHNTTSSGITGTMNTVLGEHTLKVIADGYEVYEQTETYTETPYTKTITLTKQNNNPVCLIAVKDRDGNVITDATVTITAKSNGEEFSLEPNHGVNRDYYTKQAPAGEYTYRVRKGGYLEEKGSLTLPLATSPLEVVLCYPVSIKVKVTNQAGTPLAGVSLSFDRDGYTGTTDTDGIAEFTIKDNPTPYIVTAAATTIDGEKYEAGSVEVADMQNGKEYTIIMANTPPLVFDFVFTVLDSKGDATECDRAEPVAQVGASYGNMVYSGGKYSITATCVEGKATEVSFLFSKVGYNDLTVTYALNDLKQQADGKNEFTLSLIPKEKQVCFELSKINDEKVTTGKLYEILAEREIMNDQAASVPLESGCAIIVMKDGFRTERRVWDGTSTALSVKLEAAAVKPPEEGYSLSISVTDKESGNPISLAKAQVLEPSLSGSVATAHYSDVNGVIRYYNLKKGEYKLRISRQIDGMENYVTEEETVTITVGPSEVAESGYVEVAVPMQRGTRSRGYAGLYPPPARMESRSTGRTRGGSTDVAVSVLDNDGNTLNGAKVYIISPTAFLEVEKEAKKIPKDHNLWLEIESFSSTTELFCVTTNDALRYMHTNAYLEMPGSAAVRHGWKLETAWLDTYDNKVEVWFNRIYDEDAVKQEQFVLIENSFADAVRIIPSNGGNPITAGELSPVKPMENLKLEIDVPAGMEFLRMETVGNDKVFSQIYEEKNPTKSENGKPEYAFDFIMPKLPYPQNIMHVQPVFGMRAQLYAFTWDIINTNGEASELGSTVIEFTDNAGNPLESTELEKSEDNGSSIKKQSLVKQSRMVKANIELDPNFEFVSLTWGGRQEDCMVLNNPIDGKRTFGKKVRMLEDFKVSLVVRHIAKQIEPRRPNTTPVGKASLSKARAYPVPMTDRLWVEGIAQPTTYRLYNTLGQVLLHGTHTGGSTLQIDVAQLGHGLYILELVPPQGNSQRIRLLK